MRAQVATLSETNASLEEEVRQAKSVSTALEQNLDRMEWLLRIRNNKISCGF